MIKKHQIPNILTISRVLAIIPIIAILSISHTEASYVWVMLLFAYACITDFVDGYLSRKWNCISDLGRLLDPIADKLLIAVLLIMLIPAGAVSEIAVSLILIRELFISGLREFMQEQKIIIHVTALAKCKTALQMVACGLFLCAGIFPDEMRLLISAKITLWFAVFLTVVTGLEYFLKALKQIKS